MAWWHLVTRGRAVCWHFSKHCPKKRRCCPVRVLILWFEKSVEKPAQVILHFTLYLTLQSLPWALNQRESTWTCRNLGQRCGDAVCVSQVWIFEVRISTKLRMGKWRQDSRPKEASMPWHEFFSAFSKSMVSSCSMTLWYSTILKIAQNDELYCSFRLQSVMSKAVFLWDSLDFETTFLPLMNVVSLGSM